MAKQVLTYKGRAIEGEVDLQDLIDKLDAQIQAQAQQHTALLAKLDEVISALGE